MKQKLTLTMVLVTALLTSACGENEFESATEASSQSVANTGSNFTYNPAAIQPATNGYAPDGGPNPGPSAPPTPRDAKLDFLRMVHKEIFRGTQYDHSTWDPSASLTFWRNRYNPSAGIGCRAIVEAFLLAQPTRPQAMNAYGVYASGPDTALTGYIQMQYRALLPGVDPGPFYSGPQHSIYRWYVDRHITMTQLDAIFLDHPVLQNRCAAAGLSF